MAELLDPVAGRMGQAELVVLVVLVGAGTYLMRAAPLLAALLRRGDREQEEDAVSPSGGLTGLLRLVGPSVLAALLVTSLLPDPSEPGFWPKLALNAAALLPACLAAIRWKDLGLTVLAGTVSYLLLSALT